MKIADLKDYQMVTASSCVTVSDLSEALGDIAPDATEKFMAQAQVVCFAWKTLCECNPGAAFSAYEGVVEALAEIRDTVLEEIENAN